MICPFMSKQMNSSMFPCVDDCALKIQGECALAVLAQAQLAQKNQPRETTATNSSEKN